MNDEAKGEIELAQALPEPSADDSSGATGGGALSVAPQEGAAVEPDGPRPLTPDAPAATADAVDDALTGGEGPLVGDEGLAAEPDEGAGAERVQPGTGAATLQEGPEPAPADALESGTAGGTPVGDEGDFADGDAEPRRLIEDEPLDTAAGEATATPGPIDAADPVVLAIPPEAAVPGTGDLVRAPVEAGQVVRLLDPAFDPASATYAVDGDDLVITLLSGGVLVLEGFFAGAGGEGAATASLSVLQGPLVPADELLGRAEAAPTLAQAAAAEPAAPPTGPQAPDGPASDGGGAAFRPYVPADLGDGLAITGVQPPTALGYTVNFGDLLPFGADGVDDAGPEEPISPPPGPPVSPPEPPISPPEPPVSPPEPPVSPPPGPPVGGAVAPSITLANRVSDTIEAEGGEPFEPEVRPELPNLDGTPVPEGEINGVPKELLTLDANREVRVTLVSETSRSVDSLLVHNIADDGTLTDTRVVFAGMNTPDQLYFEPDQAQPGDTASLGVVNEGTRLGFVLVNDGDRDYDALFGSGEGRFELRNPDGGPANFNDKQPPQLVHVAPDGAETVIEERLLFTADDSQRTPNDNSLNPDGRGRAVSGVTDDNRVIIGIEDGEGPTNRYDTGYDRDFNDAVFAVSFGDGVGPTDPGGPGGRLIALDMDLAADIEDPDSAEMSKGVVRLREGMVGDRLTLPDGVLDGTGIDADVIEGGRAIRLTGDASIADYEAVISAVNLSVSAGSPEAGERVIVARVTDDTGLVSNTARTVVNVDVTPLDDPEGDDDLPPVTIDEDGVPIVVDGGDGDGDGTPGGGDGDGPNLIVGTDGDDELVGASVGEGPVVIGEGNDLIRGLGGDDILRGRSGDDTLEGGAGDDFLGGGPGSDILEGGPGDDRVVLGSRGDDFGDGDADTVVIGGGEGVDRVKGFVAGEDRLDLSGLFEDAGVDPDVGSLDALLELTRVDTDEGSNVRLSFDPDGAGGREPEPVAVLVNPQGVSDLASLGIEPQQPSGGSDGATA